MTVGSPTYAIIYLAVTFMKNLAHLFNYLACDVFDLIPIGYVAFIKRYIIYNGSTVMFVQC